MNDNVIIGREVESVKALGEKIGYGHLMQLASALWRKSLKEKDYPVIGAFIPTIVYDLSEEQKSGIKLYDKLVKEI